MLNINNVESTNECYITGTLSELNIVEDTSKTSGKPFVRGVANIRVDQVINGKVVENIIPIRMFSMKYKKDGSENPNYARIVGYKNSLISLASAETPSQASRITCAGKSCNLKENMIPDRTTGKVRTYFEINTNFLNSARADDEDQAKYTITGILLNIRPEVDRENNDTNRAILSIGVVQYGGSIDVIEFIAADEAKVHAETNWNIGDTIKITGRINMTSRVVEWDEEQGFGEPIHHKRTESCRELLITGGSSTGLEEELSYDADEVKAACAERKARIEALQNQNQQKASAPKKNDGFSF